jgi:tetratricopeptide (TPR) repeat protein
MVSYLQSLEIKKKILGPNHVSVGKTLNNIGSVYYVEKDFPAALAAYTEAQAILLQNLGSDHLDVGTVTSNMGDVHCGMGNREAALKEYRQALTCRWQRLGPSDPKVVRLMEHIADLEMKLTAADDSEMNGTSTPRDAELEQDDAYQDEMRALHHELEEDLQFFDNLARMAAVDAIKDKTRVFREMREICDGSDAESSMRDDSEHSTNLVSRNPFGSAHREEADTSRKTPSDPAQFSLIPINPVEANAVAGDAPMIVDPPGENATADRDESVDECAAARDRDTPSSESYAEGVIEQQSSLVVEISGVGEKVPAADAADSRKRGILSLSRTPSPRVLKRKPSSSPKSLSPEERKEALNSVRERLAKLRASREDPLPVPLTPSTPSKVDARKEEKEARPASPFRPQLLERTEAKVKPETNTTIPSSPSQSPPFSEPTPVGADAQPDTKTNSTSPSRPPFLEPTKTLSRNLLGSPERQKMNTGINALHGLEV